MGIFPPHDRHGETCPQQGFSRFLTAEQNRPPTRIPIILRINFGVDRAETTDLRLLVSQCQQQPNRLV